ncbi:MAG: DUF4265 domain-containing protein [Aridibacter sp.]
MSQKGEKREELEKVYVDLPNHWAVSGESMWAKTLGNDLYEIRNIPFYAYGLNFLDKVKVDSSDENHKPIVLEIVELSGFKTLRLAFDDDFDEVSQNKLFDELKQFNVEVERDTVSHVALSIEPESDYDAIYDKLSEF